MTGEDRSFAWEHAHAYADHGSTAHLAMGYAMWFVDRFCVDGAEMEDLPSHDHPCAYSTWYRDEMPRAAELWEMAGRIVADEPVPTIALPIVYEAPTESPYGEGR